MKLLSFGEILFDVFDDNACLGGAPLNLASHAALQGADTYVLSAVGNDEFGKKAINEIENLKVKTDYIKVLEERETGKCLVTLNEAGIPSYNVLDNVAYDFIPETEFNNEKFDVLCFGTMALRHGNNIKTLKNIIKENNFKDVYADLNIREPFYSEESVRFCFENATIVKISDEELPVVTESLFKRSFSIKEAVNSFFEKFLNVKLIIITCGEKGSYAFERKSGIEYFQNAYPTEVVSTVGAGDSFGATFLVNYFNGDNIDKCLKKAAKISAFVVSHKEAVPIDIVNIIKSCLSL